MCDFSLQSTQSRPAKIGDKLTTRNFGTGTRGFAAPEDPITFHHLGRLIGNAVPVRLGRIIGRSIVKHLELYSA